MRFATRIAVATAGAATVVLATAGTALAGLAPHTEQVTNGVAGYKVNDSGNWRIRDAHSAEPVTAAMKDLNGTGDGATGNQLCDPNTGFAAQLGLIWNPTGGPAATGAFEVHFDTGYLPEESANTDGCNNGLIDTLPADAPRLLQTINIQQGDLLVFDVYYNRTFHTVKFTATDVTQDVTRQAYRYVGWREFFEAGIGVFSTNVPALTPPTADPVAVTTQDSFNNYSAAHGSHSILGAWETQQVETVNGGDQVVLSPNSSLDTAGDAFTVFEGGII